MCKTPTSLTSALVRSGRLATIRSSSAGAIPGAACSRAGDEHSSHLWLLLKPATGHRTQQPAGRRRTVELPQGNESKGVFRLHARGAEEVSGQILWHVPAGGRCRRGRRCPRCPRRPPRAAPPAAAPPWSPDQAPHTTCVAMHTLRMGASWIGELVHQAPPISGAHMTVTHLAASAKSPVL